MVITELRNEEFITSDMDQRKHRITQKAPSVHLLLEPWHLRQKFQNSEKEGDERKDTVKTREH
jgi:hypothetical protein